MTSEYKKSNEGNATIFDVTPADPPFFWGQATWVVIGSMIMFGLTGNGFFGLKMFIVLGCAASVYFALWRSPKTMKYREPADFKVDTSGITTKGVVFPKDEIHRLIIRNHLSGSESSYIVHAVGGNFAANFGGALSASSQMVHQKRVRVRSLVSFRVDLEAAGKATTLAGGLTETTAYGLMTDIGNIIGLARA